MSYARQIVPNRVYLVTRRCTQRQFLLRPDDDTNNAFVYCLAYAAEKTKVGVVAFIANSNHYHAVVVDIEGRIPKFLEIFHKLLAKHQNALRGRFENFWSSEHTSLVELVSSDDVLAKVVYTLTNPVKDQLVEATVDWPGAASLTACLDGKILSATRPKRFFRSKGKMPESLSLECIRAPGFEDLTGSDYRSVLAAAIESVEKDAAAERRLSGRSVLGRAAILAQSPTDSPKSDKPRRTLDPRVAARDKGPRFEAIQRVKSFRGAYADIRNGWLAGEDVVFPEGTWWLRQFAGVRCQASPAPV